MGKSKPFNNPFRGLKLEKVAPAPRKAPAPKPAPPPEPELDEDALFRELMGEVQPVRGGPVIADRPRPPPARVQQDEDEEVLDTLSELVAGHGPFDIADSDEFIEGAVPDLDKRILRRLRRGDYAIQAHLDLHGMVRTEARLALERFIAQSRWKGLRCVLVVHGRGLHSKDQIPVLKEGVQRWLSRGQTGRGVLAFTTARPHDGGAGAVYVLLRR